MAANERGEGCGEGRVGVLCGKTWTTIDMEFLVFATVASVILMCFSSHRIHVLKAQEQPMSSEIVMLLSEVFSVYYIFHGIFGKRFCEIIVFMIATLLDVIYCTVDFNAKTSPDTLDKARIGLDWSMGCILPCIFGYYVIKSYGLNTDRKKWLDNLLLFDLQLQVSSLVFVVTDRQVDVEELVTLILGLLFSAAFFWTGKLLTAEDGQRLARVRSWCRDKMCCGEQMRLQFLFMGLGTTTFLFMLYKSIKQRDGIASGVYLDVMSLVFSLLAVIIRLVVLGLGCSTATDNEYQQIEDMF